jgi:hypothetical protein
LAPTQPSGSTSICGGFNYNYTTTSVPNATSYVWTIDPASAGTITGNGLTATDLVEILDSELKAHEELVIKNGADAATLCINAAKTVIVGAEAGVKSAIEILTTGADYLGKTVHGVWQKVSTADAGTPTVCIMGGPSRNQTYVDLIKRSINSHLECNFTTAKSDHLVGAPLTAQLYPAGVDPLFKWWHA